MLLAGAGESIFGCLLRVEAGYCCSRLLDRGETCQGRDRGENASKGQARSALSETAAIVADSLFGRYSHFGAGYICARTVDHRGTWRENGRWENVTQGPPRSAPSGFTARFFTYSRLVKSTFGRRFHVEAGYLPFRALDHREIWRKNSKRGKRDQGATLLGDIGQCGNVSALASLDVSIIGRRIHFDAGNLCGLRRTAKKLAEKTMGG